MSPQYFVGVSEPKKSSCCFCFPECAWALRTDMWPGKSFVGAFVWSKRNSPRRAWDCYAFTPSCCFRLLLQANALVCVTVIRYAEYMDRLFPANDLMDTEVC
eukprot:4544467-Amphidinium_carterae.1